MMARETERYRSIMWTQLRELELELEMQVIPAPGIPCLVAEGF
jgi:hypothetical protein